MPLLVSRDDARADVADTAIGDGPSGVVRRQDGEGCSAGAPEPPVERLHDLGRALRTALAEEPLRPPRGFGRQQAVAQAVADEEEAGRGRLPGGPGVSARLAVGHREADRADLQPAGRHVAREGAGPVPARDHGSLARFGEEIERRRVALECAEAGPRASARREAVGEAPGGVRHSRAPVDEEELDPRHAAPLERTEEELALPGVLGEVRGRLGHEERNLADVEVGEAEIPAERHRHPAGLAGLAHVLDPNAEHLPHFHLAMVTVVPLPGEELISNSFISRRAPPRPMPRPPLVV